MHLNLNRPILENDVEENFITIDASPSLKRCISTENLFIGRETVVIKIFVEDCHIHLCLFFLRYGPMKQYHQPLTIVWPSDIHNSKVTPP